MMRQHLFFVGTAGTDGHINVSPKGLDTLRIIDPNCLIWLNLTGSGNETAAHVLENGRMTLMFCSFDEHPLILRVYGHTKTIHPRDEAWNLHMRRFEQHAGARQFFQLKVDEVMTSCGFGVPLYEFKKEREALSQWADHKGPAGIEKYWNDKNRRSLDGKPTGIFPADSA